MRDASQVTMDPHDGVIHVNGALTLATANTALDAADAAFSACPAGALVFDLANVNACDSAALAVLLEWLRRAGARGSTLAYRNVPSRLLQLARISELETVLPITA